MLFIHSSLGCNHGPIRTYSVWVNGCYRVDSINRFVPSWLTKVVRTYLSRIFPTVFVVQEYSGDDAPEWSLRDRTVFAMILALYSVGTTTSANITVHQAD